MCRWRTQDSSLNFPTNDLDECILFQLDLRYRLHLFGIILCVNVVIVQAAAIFIAVCKYQLVYLERIEMDFVARCYDKCLCNRLEYLEYVSVNLLFKLLFGLSLDSTITTP